MIHSGFCQQLPVLECYRGRRMWDLPCSQAASLHLTFLQCFCCSSVLLSFLVSLQQFSSCLHYWKPVSLCLVPFNPPVQLVTSYWALGKVRARLRLGRWEIIRPKVNVHCSNYHNSKSQKCETTSRQLNYIQEQTQKYWWYYNISFGSHSRIARSAKKIRFTMKRKESPTQTTLELTNTSASAEKDIEMLFLLCPINSKQAAKIKRMRWAYNVSCMVWEAENTKWSMRWLE